SRSFLVPISFFSVHWIIGRPVLLMPRPTDGQSALGRFYRARFRRSLIEKELARVLRNSVDPDLVVQVRTRRASGVAHRAKLLSPFNSIAGLDQHFSEVPIARLDPVAVVKRNHVPVIALRTCEYHRPIRWSIDRLARLGCNIQSGVHHPVGGVGIQSL